MILSLCLALQGLLPEHSFGLPDTRETLLDWNDPTRGPVGKLIGLENMMPEEGLKESAWFVQPLEQKAKEQLVLLSAAP